MPPGDLEKSAIVGALNAVDTVDSMRKSGVVLVLKAHPEVALHLRENPYFAKCRATLARAVAVWSMSSSVRAGLMGRETPSVSIVSATGHLTVR